MKVNSHVLCQVDLLTMSLRVIKHWNMQVGNTSKHLENTPLMLEMSFWSFFINANRRGKGPRRINIWLKMRFFRSPKC